MNFKGNKTVVEARICACHFYCPGARLHEATQQINHHPLDEWRFIECIA